MPKTQSSIPIKIQVLHEACYGETMAMSRERAETKVHEVLKTHFGIATNPATGKEMLGVINLCPQVFEETVEYEGKEYRISWTPDRGETRETAEALAIAEIIENNHADDSDSPVKMTATPVKGTLSPTPVKGKPLRATPPDAPVVKRTRFTEGMPSPMSQPDLTDGYDSGDTAKPE